ncbi:hypothetical protein AVEN_200920-1, partial [Araneus ventricosus]
RKTCLPEDENDPEQVEGSQSTQATPGFRVARCCISAFERTGDILLSLAIGQRLS